MHRDVLGEPVRQEVTEQEVAEEMDLGRVHCRGLSRGCLRRSRTIIVALQVYLAGHRRPRNLSHILQIMPYPIQTPSTPSDAPLPSRRGHSIHPPSHPSHPPWYPPASASTISPVSPIRARFGFPMTHALPTAAFEEATNFGRDFEVEMKEDIEDADVRTEIGSPDTGIEEELQLPPIRTLPPIQSYGPEVISVGEQTRLAMRGGRAVSRDVLLYSPAGVTPAPAKLARDNACDKLPPIPSHVPRQATSFDVQSMPMADGSGRFATICAPPRGGIPGPMSSRPVYPPAGMTPFIAGHRHLPSSFATMRATSFLLSRPTYLAKPPFSTSRACPWLIDRVVLP
ncbi:hypothetical protein FRC10_011935 [Ceratobasidium sp. 414]|nr:hypothetical protein FRC10_011935 [Ceratobasidium sp. 414]